MNLPNGLLRTGRTAVGEPLALLRPLVGSIRADSSPAMNGSVSREERRG